MSKTKQEKGDNKKAGEEITSDFINIRVVQKEFNGEKKRFVNARELHAWLKVGRDFSNWIKDRIEKYDFVEDFDFFTAFAKFGEGQKYNKIGKIVDSKTGKIVAKEYIISLDMAKELAMVENSKIGKKVRNIMATYDEELRSIKHPKLIDYKKEFSQEDIQKLIG